MRLSRVRRAGVAAFWILQIGCGSDQPAVVGEQLDTMPPIGEVAAEIPAADEESMRRMADETDRIVIELRNHIARMRNAATPAMRAGIAQHRAQVAAVMDLLERGDVSDSPRRGMSQDQIRILRDEMQTALREMEELTTRPAADFRRRMAGHLDRLERVAALLESYAADLRREGSIQ